MGTFDVFFKRDKDKALKGKSTVMWVGMGVWSVGYSVVGRDREATLCVQAAYVLRVGECELAVGRQPEDAS